MKPIVDCPGSSSVGAGRKLWGMKANANSVYRFLLLIFLGVSFGSAVTLLAWLQLWTPLRLP